MDFFAWEPEGVFKMFSVSHILYMVIGLAIVLGLCFALRKTDHKIIHKILVAITIMALIHDPIYWIYELAVTGTIHASDSLPLYFCSLFFMVLPIAVWSKNEKLKQGALSYIATFNLIAGLAGFVFNTHLNHYPVWSFYGQSTLLYHLLMIFTSLLLWTTHYYKPNIWHSISFIIPLSIISVPAAIANFSFGSDYCFLNGGIGTPFEIISSKLSLGLYIFVFFLSIICLVNLIFFIPTIIRFIKSKKQSHTKEDLEIKG